MSWRIYYGDWSEWGPDDGPVEDAPGLNVQVIAVTMPGGEVHLVSGHNFYRWEHGRWWGSDDTGLWDYLAQPGWKKVILARTIPDETFGAIRAKAMRDHGLIVDGAP